MNVIEMSFNNKHFYFQKNGKYISSYPSTTKILSNFISSPYKVKKNGKCLILQSGSATVKINNFEDLFKNTNSYDFFKKDISQKINKQGYIVKDVKNKKVKRTSSFSGISKLTSIIGTSALTLMLATQPVGEADIKPQEEVIEVTNENALNKIIEETITYQEITQEPTSFNIEYENRQDSDDFIYTKENYQDLINYYANLYGLDPGLVLAIATQESSGNHELTAYNDYSGIGLMQIEYQVYINEYLKGYKLNEETSTFEPTSIYVSDDNISDLKANIEMGCLEMQQALFYTNYNIPLAIQLYNMGYGNLIDNVISKYAEDNNITIDDVINNKLDNGWLNYRNIINAGDSQYLEHILGYTDGNIKCINPITGEEISCNFSLENAMQR